MGNDFGKISVKFEGQGLHFEKHDFWISAGLTYADSLCHDIWHQVTYVTRTSQHDFKVVSLCHLMFFGLEYWQGGGVYAQAFSSSVVSVWGCYQCTRTWADLGIQTYWKDFPPYPPCPSWLSRASLTEPSSDSCAIKTGLKSSGKPCYGFSDIVACHRGGVSNEST